MVRVCECESFSSSMGREEVLVAFPMLLLERARCVIGSPGMHDLIFSSPGHENSFARIKITASTYGDGIYMWVFRQIPLQR